MVEIPVWEAMVLFGLGFVAGIVVLLLTDHMGGNDGNDDDDYDF